MGKVTPVFVYTSGDEVELFLNGQSLGKKKKQEYEYRLRWEDVIYEPGELRAVSYKKNQKWAETVVKMTGEPVKLKLTPDKSCIKADGEDLVFIRVSFTDKDGNEVPTAENAISCTLMGAGELATHLAGRYIELPVHSLSYEEFLTFNQRQDSSESLRLYLTFGRMPYIHNLAMETDVIFEYLRNVYSTILLKDVVAREAIRNVSFLENLIAYLIDNTGSLFSAQNISKYLKSQQVNIPTQTILNYLKALCNSFFVYKIQRAETQGMKIFEIGEKYYFEDLGVAQRHTSF